MEKVNHLENKKLYHILAISGIVLLIIAFLFDLKCIIKIIFKIPCPSCGLTRGFISIINLNFIEAVKYNILSIPIFICTIIFYILYILYIFLKKEYIFKYYNIFVKNYKIIIILFLISWVINIVK